MKRVLFLVALVATGVVTFAQSYKIAYVDADLVMNLHPQIKSIQSQIDTESKVYQGQIQQLMQEYQTKATDYQRQAQSGVVGQAALNDLQRQIMSLEQRIQQLEQDAQVELMKKQNQLLEPIKEEVINAIDAVAKAKGYDYVLNQNINGNSVILYVKKQKEDNVTLDVMKQLSIPVPAELQAEFDKL